jgi:hypothetical protein
MIQLSQVTETFEGIVSAVIATTRCNSAPILIPSLKPAITAVEKEVPEKAAKTMNHQKVANMKGLLVSHQTKENMSSYTG